jgi:Uma2 family endonuclease
MEETAEQKHEFHDGEILAMSGGTYEHSVICLNVGGELRNRLQGGPCTPAEGNLRVRIQSQGRYVYPDISVVCGQPAFDPSDPNRTTILNPTVIVEVLSDSTEQYDRSKQFFAYRDVPSLEEYVLVSQHVPRVETFRRQVDGTWKIAGYFEGLEAIAMLTSLNVKLPLAEVYRNIQFAAPATPVDPSAES